MRDLGSNAVVPVCFPALASPALGQRATSCALELGGRAAFERSGNKPGPEEQVLKSETKLISNQRWLYANASK